MRDVVIWLNLHLDWVNQNVSNTFFHILQRKYSPKRKYGDWFHGAYSRKVWETKRKHILEDESFWIILNPSRSEILLIGMAECRMPNANDGKKRVSNLPFISLKTAWVVCKQCLPKHFNKTRMTRTQWTYWNTISGKCTFAYNSIVLISSNWLKITLCWTQKHNWCLCMELFVFVVIDMKIKKNNSIKLKCF